MRLSFYSGLALAMIAADTAKAQETSEAADQPTTLSQGAVIDGGVQKDDWELTLTETKTNDASSSTADTGSDIDNLI